MNKDKDEYKLASTFYVYKRVFPLAGNTAEEFGAETRSDCENSSAIIVQRLSGRLNVPDAWVKQIPVTHQDNRRSLTEILNGQPVAQVHMVSMHEEALIGQHYHLYGQFNYLMSGDAVAWLVSVKNPTVRDYVKLMPGDLIRIPPLTAYKIKVSKDSMMFGFAEKAFISPFANNHSYVIEEWEE